MMITIYLNKRWFDLVKNGDKKYEARILDKFLEKISVPTQVNFSYREQTVTKTIISRQIYSSFHDLLVSVSLEKILPGVDTIENGISFYQNIYRKKMIGDYRVICFEIE
jgi:ASC-1-like (ASCH) protein